MNKPMIFRTAIIKNTFKGKGFKMINKKLMLLAISVLLIFAVSLAGCGATSGSDPVSAPLQNTDGVFGENTVSASAEIVPQKWASLGFYSGGQDIELRVNEGDYVHKDTILASSDDLAAQAGLEAARAQLEAANAQVMAAKANLEPLTCFLCATEAQLEAARAAITSAEASVEAAKAGIDQAGKAWGSTFIYSPFAGTIIEVNAHSGENALPGQQIFLLADLSTLIVQTTDLSELDAIRVKEGDPVEVSFDAMPDITVSGKVIQVSNKKSVGSGVYYSTKIALDSIPENLRWGMSAFVVITVE
jgi:RND family efflux transporter MFP subunit